MFPTIQLFCAYHKPFPLLPKVDFVTAMQVGKAISPIKLAMPGDDSGENISQENPYYSEVTLAYWVMKNADRSQADAWGLCHYRRYFIENRTSFLIKKGSRCYFRTDQKVLDKVLAPKLYKTMGLLLSHHDIIVQRPAWAMKERGIVYNIKDAYSQLHIKSDYDATMEVVLEKYPHFERSIEGYGQMKKMSYNNMMIARWNLWDDYLGFLFTVLGEVQQRINVHKKGYQSRVFGFLAERLHNLFIYHHKLKTAHLTLGLFEDQL